MHYTDRIPAPIYRHNKIEYFGKIAIGHELAHHAGIPGHLRLGIMRDGDSQARYFRNTRNTVEGLTKKPCEYEMNEVI